MKRIYSISVENRSGVLAKIASLFRRRAFNIDSLVVGETGEPGVSSMTIVSSGDEHTLTQIEKQLNKKLDIIKVRTFAENESVNCELMLVKVHYSQNTRHEIMDVCTIMDAKIVDMSKSQMIIQMCDSPDRTSLLIHMLQPVGIIEVARTGMLALPRCFN